MAFEPTKIPDQISNYDHAGRYLNTIKRHLEPPKEEALKTALKGLLDGYTVRIETPKIR